MTEDHQKRSEGMERALEALFPNETKNRREGRCAICGRKVDLASFRDELSRKEFGISGVCQECQDKTFGRSN